MPNKMAFLNVAVCSSFQMANILQQEFKLIYTNISKYYETNQLRALTLSLQRISDKPWVGMGANGKYPELIEKNVFRAGKVKNIKWAENLFYTFH